MLEPLVVDPNRSVASAANNIAAARLVFPAPAGPTSAITRVPLDGCPAMRLSLRAVQRRASRSKGAPAPVLKISPSACFQPFARGLLAAEQFKPVGRGKRVERHVPLVGRDALRQPLERPADAD